MILIWGFKARLKALERGTFYCPQCGGDREYARMQVRKWFTFFWIPIIPLKVLGELVQCETCQSQYDEAVLGMPTAAELTDHLTNALRVGVAHMVMLSANSPAARDRAVAVVSATGAAYDEATLDVDLAGSSPDALHGWLRHLAETLTVHGKETLLGQLAEVAAADGPIDDAERAALTEAGQHLLMTPAHTSGVVSQIGTSAS